MLSATTLSYLSPKPDVNDQQIDALVEYAVKEHRDAWEAIRLMHELGQDSMIDSYLLRLGDQRLASLGRILPNLWRRSEAYEKEVERRQAETDTQPAAMQTQADLQQMMDRATRWMRAQSASVCTSVICRAIEATVKAGMVRCKQDWAGLKRLISDDGGWLEGLTNNAFAQMVAEHCDFDRSMLPSEATLKVLSFGSTHFPAWKPTGYDPKQLRSLVQMASYFLNSLEKQMSHSANSAMEKIIAV